MLLFYVRHGDPIYNPDQLTPLGQRQAEAVARRLALYGVDKIFASTSTRAIQTATPTAEILKKEITQLDFAHENHAMDDFAVPNGKGGRVWSFVDSEIARIFVGNEIRKYGNEWYEHPALRKYENFKPGVERINREVDAFLASLGYEHDREENIYRITTGGDERVALFAHEGFGRAFIASVLDMPFPQVSVHCHMTHSAVTVLEFPDLGGYSIPRMLTMSNDSHIYRDGLPTNYCNRIRF